MRPFLFTDDDGEPVAEGVEFADRTRVVKWLDDNQMDLYGPTVEDRSLDAATAEEIEVEEHASAWILVWLHVVH
jgi:hypothetical protein